MDSFLKHLSRFFLLGLLSTPLLSQEIEVAAETDSISGKWAIFGSMSVDYTTGHYFFGVPLENQGKIVQPSLTLGAMLPKGARGSLA